MKFLVRYFLLTVAPLLALAAANAQSVSEISLLAGEKWWGIFAADSPVQPFAAPFETQTANSSGNAFRIGYLLSSSGRYARFDEPAAVAFDGNKFTITSGGARIDAAKGGRTLRQAYLAMHHRDLRTTDKFPPPELFTELVYETAADFGFLQSAADVCAYGRRLLDEGYPPGIMVLGEGWRDAPEYGFNAPGFTDPDGFVDEMHAMGFKVMLTVTPYVAAWGTEFAALRRDGKLVTASDGTPLVISGPDGVFAALDLTVPATAAALKESLSRLRGKYGVDGFRFDCSLLIPEIAADTGFATAYLQAMEDVGADFALTEYMPGQSGFGIARAAAIRTPQLTETGYAADMIIAGFAAGPFTQVLPAAGFADGGSDREQIRYALMMAVMPVARIPFAPWKHGFAAAEMKRTLAFRASLSKYMGAMWSEACKTVEPIVRPMEYNFSNSGFADCGRQYMLGDKYLIAPALDDSPRRLVRLPKGVWRDMSGRKLKGPLVIEAETDGYRMSWFELQ